MHVHSLHAQFIVHDADDVVLPEVGGIVAFGCSHGAKPCSPGVEHLPPLGFVLKCELPHPKMLYTIDDHPVKNGQSLPMRHLGPASVVEAAADCPHEICSSRRGFVGLLLRTGQIVRSEEHTSELQS